MTAGLAAALQLTSEAATLSITGVDEGSQLVLPPFTVATNLLIGAVASPGLPDVAFSLEAHGEILQHLTAGPPYALTFSNLPAGKYFLAANVATNASVTADVSFDIQPTLLRPPNDSWAQAILITNIAQPSLGTNAFASHETGEPVHAQNGGGRSLWWNWQASSNGVVTITTAGSSFDTVLGIYTGTNVAALSLVTENDDAGSANRFSQASFNAIAGSTYFIAVDGALTSDGHTSTGAVQLSLIAATPPTVTVLSPTNGFARVVTAPFSATDVNVAVAISDPIGISSVDYVLDGAGLTRTGVLSPPYQGTLSNLLAGDYLLSVNAINAAGLITSIHTSFSVVSAAPELRFVDGKTHLPSGFQFAVTGLKGMAYELQTASNMPAWSTWLWWTNFDGALRVIDTNAAQHSARFYRVVAP